MRDAFCLALLAAIWMMHTSAHAEWAIEGDQLLTRWAADVSPDNALPEYPRPDMVRTEWRNLNGLWDYAIAPKDKETCKKFDGQILVPFPIESALSGVKTAVQPDQRLWYKRTFEVPEAWKGQHLLLHFGAVDWECTVWVNGQEVGAHRGGYDAFCFDVTSALTAAGPQEILVAVWDPTDTGYQPRGKQISEPKGIWYTAVTGIWQTVWIEPVPDTSIQRLKNIADIEAKTLSVDAAVLGAAEGDTLEAQALDGDAVAATATGKPGTPLVLALDAPKRWSPDSPFLYGLKVTLKRGGQVIDEVSGYFGMRKIALAKDEKGINRLFLNNEPLFQFGPLDQGWWPDGLYTAPTDAALRYDVEMTRNMGFNMARKHVKVEPARWYYHCDQLGLLVWQDMPSGDKYIGPNDPDIKRSKESEENYYHEFQAVIDMLHNHPSIVMWVPFNEGWGQFDTNTVTQWTKQYDPTRLVNQTSGWSDRGGSDVYDKHSYPGPDMFPVEEKRASVLGEFGGLGWPVEGHLWWNKRNWGYRNYDNLDDLREHYANLIFWLRPLIGNGLAAAVYTQTTDVEGEVNGLMTYDRAMVKMDADWLAKTNGTVFLPAPAMRVLLPTSEAESRLWRYTTEEPKGEWKTAGYDDSAWKEGPAVFGTEGTPGARIRTVWDTPDIWVRQSFELGAVPEKGVFLMLHHDEDAAAYINGTAAVHAKGFNANYVPYAVSEEACAALRTGSNTLAIHCSQTRGGQCIDAGLVVVDE